MNEGTSHYLHVFVDGAWSTKNGGHLVC